MVPEGVKKCLKLTPFGSGSILAKKVWQLVTSRERFAGFLSQSRIDRVPFQLQSMVLAALAVRSQKTHRKRISACSSIAPPGMVHTRGAIRMRRKVSTP
jgi:hypothetical protein